MNATELITRIRGKVKDVHFSARQLLGLGALPNALIIGAARCGTTSLFDYLAQHPNIGTSRLKELRFFDWEWERGTRWYRANFPAGREKLIRLEATPFYLLHPEVPERVRSLLDNPRLIVMLREPVARAYSYWHLRRKTELETLSFEEAIEREDERVHWFWYLKAGRYAEQLERWLAVYPRASFHFIKSEDFYAEPAAELDRLTDWLGLPRHEFTNLVPSNPSKYSRPLKPEMRERLEKVFAQSNARVAELTGISWP